MRSWSSEMDIFSLLAGCAIDTVHYIIAAEDRRSQTKSDYYQNTILPDLRHFAHQFLDTLEMILPYELLFRNTLPEFDEGLHTLR